MDFTPRTNKEIQAHIAKSIGQRDGIKAELVKLKAALEAQQKLVDNETKPEQKIQAAVGLITAAGDVTNKYAELGLHCGILGGLYFALGYPKDQIKELLASEDYLDLENI